MGGIHNSGDFKTSKYGTVVGEVDQKPEHMNGPTRLVIVTSVVLLTRHALADDGSSGPAVIERGSSSTPL